MSESTGKGFNPTMDKQPHSSSKDKSINDEPPQDRLTQTDWEWDLAELSDPGEEHPPLWVDRQ